jgi:hypothetical protein
LVWRIAAIAYVRIEEILMSEEDKLSEEDKTLMDQYGITCTPKMVYFYKQYRYENLADALRYAESDHAATPDQKAAPLARNSS